MYRIYADTSAIGGCEDPQFAVYSRRMIELAHHGKLLLLLSAVVIEELEDAPASVRQVLSALPPASVEAVAISPEVLQLRDAYVNAGILAPEWMGDATHVAAASVARADAIVSWNFKHIVRLDKIKAYNRINQRLGYPELTIITPMVVFNEFDQD